MLLLPATPFLDVPVRPLFYGNAWFHRVQRWTEFGPRQNPVTGDMVVGLGVTVLHFHCLPGGGVGPSAQALMPVGEHTKFYRADNTEAVDLSDYQVVELTQGHLTEAEYKALLDADPRPLMRRGDAFRTMFYTLPEENQLDMLQQAMELADQAPYFRFGQGPQTMAECLALTPEEARALFEPQGLPQSPVQPQ